MLFGKKRDAGRDSDYDGDNKGNDSLEKNAHRAGVILQEGDIERHVQASGEYVKAYTGVDPITGKTMQKSLSSIAKSKINPKYRKQNIKQQAGFSAEVLDTADRNAGEILAGSGKRYSRVDDVPGRPVNETAYDITAFNGAGEELISESVQMKFTNSNAKSQARRLTSAEFQEKYPHGSYAVPKDRYDEIKKCLEAQEKKLRKQLEKARSKGDGTLEDKISQKLEYTQTVRGQLKPSTVTSKRAIAARLHPKAEAFKGIIRTGHDQGMNAGKLSAEIQGAISAAQHVNLVLQGEMKASEAAGEIAKDAAAAYGMGYVTGHAGNMLGTAFKSSSKGVIQKLGEGSMPVNILMLVKDTSVLVADMLDGKIDSYECMEGIAKSGTNIFGTAMVGMAVGGPAGFVASLISGVIIDSALECAMKEIRKPYLKAKQERLQIEAQCEMLRMELERYREGFRNTYVAYTEELTQVFGTSLRGMAEALKINDPDMFIGNANQITEKLGGTAQFSNVDEFEDFLKSGDALEL